MMLSDLVQEVHSAMTSNKARSGLTMLGIVIGIASVVAMVAIGAGAQKSIEASIESIGSNLLIVRPNRQGGPGSQIRNDSAQTLNETDAIEIGEKIQNINSVAPYSSGNYRAIAQGNNVSITVVGTADSYAEVSNVEIENGTFFSDQQNARLSKVAVVGPDISDELYGQENVVGKKFRINGIEFTIVGTTAAKGEGGFGSSPDETIYIPLTTFQQYLSGSNSLSAINIQVSGQQFMDVAQVQVENLLLARHGISSIEDADFRVVNQADIVETASSVAGTLTLLLGAVAGISLVVGGIGIMNMMLTTVTERTREIGLRKAIGARRADISKQFLAEAMTLTFFGGVIGVGLGWVISQAVKIYGSLETEVSLFSVILAFGVSALIGIVFGYFPARRASKLNPIEALRYE